MDSNVYLLFQFLAYYRFHLNALLGSFIYLLLVVFIILLSKKRWLPILGHSLLCMAGLFNFSFHRIIIYNSQEFYSVTFISMKLNFSLAYFIGRIFYYSLVVTTSMECNFFVFFSLSLECNFFGFKWPATTCGCSVLYTIVYYTMNSCVYLLLQFLAFYQFHLSALFWCFLYVLLMVLIILPHEDVLQLFISIHRGLLLSCSVNLNAFCWLCCSTLMHYYAVPTSGKRDGCYSRDIFFYASKGFSTWIFYRTTYIYFTGILLSYFIRIKLYFLQTYFIRWIHGFIKWFFNAFILVQTITIPQALCIHPSSSVYFYKC